MAHIVQTKSSSIEVETKRVRHGARGEFENLFGRYAFDTGSGYQGVNIPVGTIKNLALKYGIKAVRVNNENIKIDRNNPATMFDKIDESVYDELEDEGIDLYNKFLEFIVEDSPWLAQKDPFRMIFGQFVEGELIEDEDPTEDTSETGFSSASVGLET